MDITEIRSKKEILKKEIDTLVLDFIQETGVVVSEINLKEAKNVVVGKEKEEIIFCGAEIKLNLD